METIENKIEAILEKKIRPSLRSHGGDIELTAYEDGVAWVRLMGQCSDCPSASLTTQYLVKENLMAELPEVRDVELDERVSEELLMQARNILFGNGI